MFDDGYSLFMHEWAWMGLGGGITILLFMLFSSFLNVEKPKPKWLDMSWIAWAASIQYMFHNAEEYGIDLTGTVLAFPNQMLIALGILPPELPLLGCNIPMVWVVGPVMAVLARKYPGCALSMASFGLINACTHIVFIPTLGYNPGLFTSLVLFIPVFIWATYVWVGRDHRGWALVIQDVLISLALHVILFGGIGATKFGALNDVGGFILMLGGSIACGWAWWYLAKRSEQKWQQKQNA